MHLLDASLRCARVKRARCTALFEAHVVQWNLVGVGVDKCASTEMAVAGRYSTFEGKEDYCLRSLIREISTHGGLDIVPPRAKIQYMYTGLETGHYLLYCRRQVVQSAERGPVIAALARTEAR
jgi:hypothetical protein